MCVGIVADLAVWRQHWVGPML